MTSHRAGPPPRTVRTVAAPAITSLAALVLTLTLGLPGLAPQPAAATTNPANPNNTANPNNPATPSVSDLQTQAQELAGQIAADGRSLDQLSASYQSAQIQYGRLATRQGAARASVAAASAAVSAARAALKSQAILAYLAGGAPIISALPGHSGLDPSLTVAYAEIVAGGQKTALQDYRATLDTQARQKAALDATARQMQVTLSTLRSDASQATATMASQKEALAQVKGQLAVAVAQVEAQQQAAERAQVQATLASEGDLPPSTPATPAASPAAPTTTTLPSHSRSTNTPTTLANTIQRGGTAPTSAPTTSPPPTRTGTAPTTTPTTTPTPAPNAGATNPAQAPGVNQVLAYARAQLGKPYQWAGAGPDSFDCSGLVMMAWEQAGIYFPHLAQDQYNLTARIPLSALIPGDLVFFGTPDNVYHVGIYIGNGNMIDAPETGQDVSVSSIYWTNLLGAGRVTPNS